MEPTENTTSNKRGKKALLIVVSILVIVLLLLALGFGVGFGVIWDLLNNINRVGETESTMSSSELQEFLDNQEPEESIYDEVVDPTDITWETEPEIIDNGPNIINILLIGSDTRLPGAPARSDTMILCTLNKERKTLTLTSFMRDLYVQIPGASPNRMNVPYVFGGIDRLNKTLERNFGIQVDGDFAVEFDSFKDVIDLIGGVTINLTKAEANYMNSRDWLAYGYMENGGRVYVEGENLLNGAEALGYSRIRAIDSDFGRTLRQRNVLTAIFNKCKNLSIPQLYKLMEQVLPLLTTNMDNVTILSYAAQAAPLLADLKLETLRIPVDGSYAGVMVDGMAVLKADIGMNRLKLWEALGLEESEK